MPMVKMDSAILDLDGVTALRNDQNKVVTLRQVAIVCLLLNRQCPPEEKIADFDLAKQLKDDKANEIDLTIEQVGCLKTKIGEAQGPVFVKRCWDILDPRKDNAVEDKNETQEES